MLGIIDGFCFSFFIRIYWILGEIGFFERGNVVVVGVVMKIIFDELVV